MNVSRYSVKHPVTIIMAYVMCIGIALTMLPNLAVDLLPSTQRPVLSIATRFPGAGPADVETNITERLERLLSRSRNLVNMTSTSQFESSSITLEFSYGTNMDRAVADTQTLINRWVNSLPEGANTPVVRRFDASAAPVMRLAVRGDLPPDQLRLLAEEEVQPRLERIDGVASADVSGGSVQLVNVSVSLNRLAAFNLTLSDVTTALRGQNILSSGGNLRRGTREYQIMTQQELNDMNEIRRLVVKRVNLGPEMQGMANRSQVVRLEDISDIEIGFNENASRVFVNGTRGVFVQITTESDSNQVRVADRIHAALPAINAELPRGVSANVLTDNSIMIRATLGQVYQNALQGGILVMLILFLFLRNFKGTFIIGLSIPISILLTVMFMAVFGFTLNLLTLTGLIMAMGMTTDASIVILENIHKYRSRGAKGEIAAILGSREMLRAIMASTVTTLCVFIPLIIYKNDLEQMGQLFSDLIFTVVIAMVCSLLVAVTLVPSLCGSTLKLNTRKQKPLKNRLLRAIDNGIESVLVSIENAYKKALAYSLTHRFLVITLAGVLLVVSLMQFSSLGMNMQFRSRVNDILSIQVAMPQGTTMDVTEKVLFDLEDMIRKEVRGYTDIMHTVRRTGNFLGTTQIILPRPALQIDTPSSIIRKLTPYTSNIPGARITFQVGGGGGGGGGGSASSPIAIAISSRDNNAILATADEILSIMSRYLPEIEKPQVNIDQGVPQLVVQIDRDRAASLGVPLATIAANIRTAMDGTVATTMSRGDRLLDVRVMLRDDDRAGMPNLDAVFVTNNNGSRISLSNMASIVETRGPASIRRERQERVIRVTGDLPAEIAVTAMQRRLVATVNENLVQREGVTVRFLGEAAEIEGYYGRYILILLTAIFLVFGILASQFESFVDPFIIFFTIPMLAIGVIWIYKITGQAMTMFAIVGVIALVGVVLNSGIILVDYTNTLRARGMTVFEACLEGGRSRLRPILMTSLSTILAMTPIAFFPGVGADTIQPIAKTFVGGLLVSTMMTLFLIPAIYSLLNSRHDKKRSREIARQKLELSGSFAKAASGDA